VNPAKSPKIKASEAKIWHEWITTPPGQKAIESFRIDGQQVFFLPEIKKASSENMVWIPGGTFAWDLISTIRKKRRRTK
jgi:hypothetical protein